MPRRLVLPGSCALVLAALLSLTAFGIIGLGRDGVLNGDGQVLYAAGRAWLQGLNPYNYDALVRSVAGIPGIDLSQVRFFYPPQSSVFCILLALFPYAVARGVWLGLNLLAIASIVVLTGLILRQEMPNRWLPGAALLAAVIIANPFTAHVVWLGQTSLVAFAATFAAWRFAGLGRWLPAGICLGLASYKPQMCIFVLLWFLLELNWRALLTAGISASLLALYPVVLQGPLGILLAWRDGISVGYATENNLPSFPHKVGLESVLYAVGVSVPSGVILALGALIVVGLWRIRDRLRYEDIFALLMVITLTFNSYLHDYDYVALVPVFISLWRLSSVSRTAAITSITLTALLFVPQRLIRPFEMPLLDQWRTFVVVALALVILYVARFDLRRTAAENLPVAIP